MARTGRTGRLAADARTAAEEARELARPTGNGFADQVTVSLATLTESVDRIERHQEAATKLLAEHLSDHAQAGFGQRRTWRRWGR